MFLFDIVYGGNMALSRKTSRLVKHGINLEKKISYFSKSLDKAEKIMTSPKFWSYSHSKRESALQNYSPLAEKLEKMKVEFNSFKTSFFSNPSYDYNYYKIEYKLGQVSYKESK